MENEAKQGSPVRTFFTGVLAKVIMALLVNIGNMLIFFAVMLVLTPFLSEIAGRSPGAERGIGIFRSAVCIIIFLILRALIGYHNRVERNRFVTSGENRGGGWFSMFALYAKRDLATECAAYALFCLPFHIIIHFFSDIKYLPTFFLPQDSMLTFTGGSAIAAYFANIALYLIFTAIITPFFYVKWDRNRLYKGEK